MAAPYKLRCNIVGHKKDVRALAPALFPDGGIVSGSRDCTSSVWLPNDHDNGFTQGQTLLGHSNFVVAVCILPPDDIHPQGLIGTGSNDNTILLFEPGKQDAVAKLTGHSGTVCALASGKFGFLLSGSWDKTARVWLNKKCVLTLEGHESAVWAVAVISEKGLMLTGSADKTIRMWKAGKKERTFLGHDDCVRGLAVIDENAFLSCSNDATVRRWLTSGDCVGVYYGHTNYVYCLALLPNGSDFVTSSEDRTVRVWKEGECVQTITHPTQSVWCVTGLSNGDIVTGASDGVMRVFTREETRMASAEDQKAFENLLAASTIPTQLGDIKMDELPGPEALLTPGHKEGQSKMVRQDDRVELYTWEMAGSKWSKVGDIVGATGGSQDTSGKTLFEGKEYDYVFSVDIEEGKPPLKLPYNVTEDPWQAAQGFLHRYNLSQSFLDQVANFITQNAKGISIGAPATNLADPFTGGNRYVPGSVGGASGDTAENGVDLFTGANLSARQNNTTYGADPFTGSGSYKPQGSGSSSSLHTGHSFFPVKSYLVLDNANPKQIIAKLQEFNQTVGSDLRVEDSSIAGLEQLLAGKPSQAHVATLQRLLQWPSDKLFPALDVLRIGVKFAPVSRHFCQQPRFLEQLSGHLSPGSTPANLLLALRCLANLFIQPEGAALLGERQSWLLKQASQCPGLTSKNPQIALSTLVLNFSVAAAALQDFERKSECVSCAAALLERPLDGEAMFRLLVALGTLLEGDQMCLAVFHSLNLGPTLKALREKSELNKVIECADLLLKS